jgi:hypothetical protein
MGQMNEVKVGAVTKLVRAAHPACWDGAKGSERRIGPCENGTVVRSEFSRLRPGTVRRVCRTFSRAGSPARRPALGRSLGVAPAHVRGRAVCQAWQIPRQSLGSAPTLMGRHPSGGDVPVSASRREVCVAPILQSIPPLAGRPPLRSSPRWSRCVTGNSRPTLDSRGFPR